MSKARIVRHSQAAVKAMNKAGDYMPTRKSAAAGPSLGAGFWETARLVMPGESPKKAISLRVDSDVLNWFKARGPGYQSRMNAVLRAYMAAETPKAKKRA